VGQMTMADLMAKQDQKNLKLESFLSAASRSESWINNQWKNIIALRNKNIILHIFEKFKKNFIFSKQNLLKMSGAFWKSMGRGLAELHR
jgi:hypothetical protein